MTLLGTTVALLATLLTAWGLTKKSTPFQASYSYLNVSVAFTGPPSFQGFGIDIILRVDHITVIALLVVELCVIGAVGWHRIVGRSEPGPARYYAVVSVFLFAVIASLVSWDLAELLAFWILAGASTYLMLAHRWASDDSAGAARVALALPFITDLCLLLGVAVLYSRYGVQNPTGLIPVLHSTPGAGTKTLVVASVLLFVGVAGRLGLWPLGYWITRTAASSAPSASALAQSVWPVLSIVVLLRLMPIISASNPQTTRALLYASGVAAITAPLWSLVGNDPRRSIALAGSGIAAIGAAVVIHAYQSPGFNFAAAGVACVLAAAPARAAGVFGTSSVATAMRTDDMAEMGGAWRRMRLSAGVLLAVAVVLGLSATGALASSTATRSRFGYAAGEAVLLVSVAALRVFLAASLGPLRRRRAFEPDRVRDAPVNGIGYAYWLVFGGGVLALATLVTAWQHFLDGYTHSGPNPTVLAPWMGAAVLGFAAVTVAYVANKDGALRTSSAIGAWVGRGFDRGDALLDRFVYTPSTGIAAATSDWISAGDSALARAALVSGRIVFIVTRAPAPALLILLAVLLAAAIGIGVPGLRR
jgi:NADH:ubiquinone oxidoreductase subunit 5 (subunit L)/multisubunit Na+/H+ antiporter MnhA subunit